MLRFYTLTLILLTTMSEFGIAWWKAPVDLGPGVNKPNYIQWDPIVAPNESLFFFEKAGGAGYHLWRSWYQSGAWLEAESVGGDFDLVQPLYLKTISEGIRFYFGSPRPGGVGGEDIWFADSVTGGWLLPLNLGTPLNSSSNDNFITFSLGGRRCYISSDRPGTRGNLDLWVSDFDSVSGQWRVPVNLGDSINTNKWEQEVTVSEDDSVLYFFRVGPGPWPSAGIFGSYKRNGVWQKAIFLRPPINPYPDSMGESAGPYFVSGGRGIYFVYSVLTVHGDYIFYSDWEDVGVEEKVEARGAKPNIAEIRAWPNPFASFAVVPGYEEERFVLYDVSGRKVGIYKGNRIGERLSTGVYFLRPEGKDAKPLRIIKLR